MRRAKEPAPVASEKVVQIVVRRAKPMDVVNVFRLARQAVDADRLPLATLDEAKGVAFVLDLIRTGYVVVAELSGRVVGVLACSAYQPPHSRDFVLDGEFLAVAPRFEERGVAQALLRNVVQFARKNETPLRLILCQPDESALQKEYLGRAGFKPGGRVYVLLPEKKGAGDVNEEQVEDDSEDHSSEVAEPGE